MQGRYKRTTEMLTAEGRETTNDYPAHSPGRMGQKGSLEEGNYLEAAEE